MTISENFTITSFYSDIRQKSFGVKNIAIFSVYLEI